VDPVFAKLRGEIAAVVSLGAGALIATGYGITAARLHQVDVPVSTALGALPASYFLGEALQAMVLPLILLLSVGAIWLALHQVKGSDQEPRMLPRRIPWLPSWSGLALLLMAFAWLIDVLTHHGELGGASQGYWLAIVGLLIVVPALAGIVAPHLLGAQQSGCRSAQRSRGHLTLAVLLTALVSIIGASTIRIADAAFLEDALPAVLVSANPENCTLLGPQINTGHCYFKGYYLGENGQWLFLIWKPTTPLTYEVARKAVRRLRKNKPEADQSEIESVKEEALEKIRNRLVLVPRDDVLQILEADKPSELPEA
jgi:hypothetical protein